MLTKDQAFDINEFIYKNSHESLWRVGDKLEKILSEFAINPDKDKIINISIAIQTFQIINKMIIVFVGWIRIIFVLKMKLFWAIHYFGNIFIINEK